MKTKKKKKTKQNLVVAWAPSLHHFSLYGCSLLEVRSPREAAVAIAAIRMAVNDNLGFIEPPSDFAHLWIMDSKDEPSIWFSKDGKQITEVNPEEL